VPEFPAQKGGLKHEHRRILMRGNIDVLLQVTDYAERVNRPGDFATLRQKNKDGMYAALEQFEAYTSIMFICLFKKKIYPSD
jgi:hypothetical protein